MSPDKMVSIIFHRADVVTTLNRQILCLKEMNYFQNRIGDDSKFGLKMIRTKVNSITIRLISIKVETKTK